MHSPLFRPALWLLALAVLLPLVGGPTALAAPTPPPAANKPLPPAMAGPSIGLNRGTPDQPARPPFSVLDGGNPNIGYGFTMALLNNNARAANLGFGRVMYTLGWDSSNPSPGVYDWGDANNIANAAAATGQRVLLRVMLTPAWARPGGTTNTYPPSNPNTFGTFMGALAAHLAPYGRFDYEVWNEPNVSDNWGGMFPSPAGYVDLLRAAYPQIKSGDPGARVVGPAITTVGDLPLNSPHSAMGDLAYLNGIYDAGGAPYFDVLSDHPYGFGDIPELDPRTAGHPLVFRRVELHREIMVARGDGNKQIWATEMGWAMDPALAGHPECNRPDWYFLWSPQQQADYLTRAFQWARSRWSWMGAMYIFNFDFNQAPWYNHPCFAFDYFSVYGNPAEAALNTFTHNPPPTYTPLPTNTPIPTNTLIPSPTRTNTPVPDNGPVIESVTVNQAVYNRDGGSLQIDVVAGDNDPTPIDSVQAILTYPNGSTQLIYLTLVGGNAQHGTWRLTQSLAANTSGVDEPYQFVINVIEAFPPRRVATANVTAIVTPLRFWDVPTSHPFAPFIEWMAANNIVSGYGDGSFRPGASVTRSQTAKILVNAVGIGDVIPSDRQTFSDVPPTHPFWLPVERIAGRGVISGYGCGGPGEPCDPANRPYFRPYASVTRGQLAKMISLTMGWAPLLPTTPTFADVPATQPFFGYVEAVYGYRVINGYGCGGPGEPCDGGNRPYFRPFNSATRGQLSKMVYNAVVSAPSPTPTLPPSATPTHTAVPTHTQTATVRPSSTGTPPATVTTTRTPISTTTRTPVSTATRTPSAPATVTATTTATPGLLGPKKGAPTP